jgi:hypothetical protein
LKIAAEHGQAILFRKARKLVVEPFNQLFRNWVCHLRLGEPSEPFLARTPPVHGSPRFQGRSIGDAVEPIGKELSLADTRSLANENEKSGLKRIFRILHVPENATTDTQNERTVSFDQRLERNLVVMDQERIE